MKDNYKTWEVEKDKFGIKKWDKVITSNPVRKGDLVWSSSEKRFIGTVYYINTRGNFERLRKTDRFFDKSIKPYVKDSIFYDEDNGTLVIQIKYFDGEIDPFPNLIHCNLFWQDSFYKVFDKKNIHKNEFEKLKQAYIKNKNKENGI